MKDWRITGIYRYEIVNADDVPLKLISVSGPSEKERYIHIGNKLTFLFGGLAHFLRARMVTEEYFQIHRKDGGKE